MTTTITDCLTCGERLPERSGGGRPAQYCGADCRRMHRNELKRLDREVERLERELADAQRMLAHGIRVGWSGPAAEFFAAKLEQTKVDLAALRLGVWP